jgi:hypothetical protein
MKQAMNQLEQLKQFTTVVADTGNFHQLAQFAPQDATTNPSLILKAVQQPEYAPLLAETVAAHRGEPLEEIVDQVLVRFGLRDPQGGARPGQHRGRRPPELRHRRHRGGRAA